MSKLVISTDGASKGNPGAAGIGVVVSDTEGNILAEIGEYIGVTTNNVAEYKALIRGLEESLKLGADEVEISTDSELMARQISGVYKVKSENLKDLYAKAMSLLRCFRRVSISHVFREQNRLADKLANLGVQKDPKRMQLTEAKQDSQKKKPPIEVKLPVKAKPSPKTKAPLEDQPSSQPGQSTDDGQTKLLF